MLHRSITEHAAGCFYGSETMSELLWHFITDQSKTSSLDQWEHALQQSCYHKLVESLDKRYPHMYRLNDIQLLMEELCDGDLFTTPKLPWLDSLFAKCMRRNGDLVTYQETKVQDYCRLAAELDPTLLATWHISSWITNSHCLSPENIERIVTAQTPFFAPKGTPTKPFAEGHVHLGGISLDAAILEQHILLSTKPSKTEKNEHNIWKKEQKERLLPLIDRLKRMLFALASPNDKNHFPSQLLTPETMPLDSLKSKIDWEIKYELTRESPTNSSLWVFSQFSLAMKEDSPHKWMWLFLYLCCRYQEAETLPIERIAILCWIQTLNDVRRSLIMSGQGLSRFVRRYNAAPLRKGAKAKYVEQLYFSENDVAETKAMPSTFSAKFVKSLVQEIAKHKGLLKTPNYCEFEPDKQFTEHESASYISAIEKWHFCGHFSRSSEQGPNKRAIANTKGIWKQARKLSNTLNKSEGWNDDVFLGGKLNPHHQFQPHRWFRGLDVAGDENDLKIEWFAPAIRWLRRGFLPRNTESQPTVGFHLSIHAGEDYAHPASGMRHIDETVRFCEMQDGDRLGHALALGIIPKKWAERQGEMIVPLDEHLDNLVWIWHYASILNTQLNSAQQVIPILERKINKFWTLLSDEFENTDFTDSVLFPKHQKMRKQALKKQNQTEVTPELLFQAWLLRRNCFYKFTHTRNDNVQTVDKEIAVPDFDTLILNEQHATPSWLYKERHQRLKSSKPFPNVIIRAKNSSNYELLGKSKTSTILEDFESEAELEFLHALQDFLLTEYDSQGIIIEANPTSNVYIARLKKHSEHPIFRWNPPEDKALNNGSEHNKFGLRKGPVRVTVNTDDPGIMPTTLRTEFLLLKEAALELGVGRTQAERWLEELRLYGLEQFYKNHQSVFQRI